MKEKSSKPTFNVSLSRLFSIHQIQVKDVKKKHCTINQIASYYIIFIKFSFHRDFANLIKIKTVTKSVNALKCQFNIPLILRKHSTSSL